jgi:hypothetical protein
MNIAVLYLSLTFVVFIITEINALASILHILLNIIFLLFSRRKLQLTSGFWFIIIYMLISVSLFMVVGNVTREMIFVVHISLALLSFSVLEISMVKYLKVINITYLVYSVMSLLVYLQIFPPFLGLKYATYNWFVAADTFLPNFVLRFMNYHTYVGFNGSSSSIDSYSGFMLLINLAFLKKENKLNILILLLSSAQMLMATRMTPIIALLGLMGFLFFSKINLNTKYIILITALTSFSFILFYDKNSDYNTLFAVTHGRSMLWDRYLQHHLESSSSLELWFGTRHDFDTIQIFSNKWLNQPHSSYIRMFIIHGILGYGIIAIFLLRVMNRIKKRSYVAIVLYCVVIAITNDTIFYNNNMIYIYTLLLLYTKSVNESNSIDNNCEFVTEIASSNSTLNGK